MTSHPSILVSHFSLAVFLIGFKNNILFFNHILHGLFNLLIFTIGGAFLPVEFSNPWLSVGSQKTFSRVFKQFKLVLISERIGHEDVDLD